MRVTLTDDGCLLQPDTSREQDVLAFLARALKQTYDRPIVGGEANPERPVSALPTKGDLASAQLDNRPCLSTS